MNAWTAALATATIQATVPPAHLDWLAHAEPGSRLVRHLDTNEIGHVYPDVTRTPYGWLLVATKHATNVHRQQQNRPEVVDRP